MKNYYYFFFTHKLLELSETLREIKQFTDLFLSDSMNPFLILDE